MPTDMFSRSIRRFPTFLLLLLGCILSACGDAGKATVPAPPRLHRPNLLWISIDTLRADHLGCYGYFREVSPKIDALAERSILFERCVVPMATTLPSHLSVLTGTYPLEHGVLANVTQGGKRFVPSPALESVAEVLTELDYDTAAFVSATPLRPWTGINAGFAEFDGPTRGDRQGGATTELAMSWLEARGGAIAPGAAKRPFFLWVHLFDPHAPYKPPTEWRDRFETDEALRAYLAEREFSEESRRPTGQRVETEKSHNEYDCEVLYADDQVGRLLDAIDVLGFAANTVIVFFSDHGEGLGQHDEPAHGLVWHEQVHAAFLLHLPGEAPRRESGPVSSVDIFPTIFGRVDVPGIERFLEQASGIDVLAPGRSARPLWSQSSKRQRIFGQDTLYALTLGSWKYVTSPEGPGALYQLDEDPYELTDVAEKNPDVARRMAEQLERTREAQELRGVLLEAGGEGELDGETLRRLKELGYVDEE